MKTNLFILFIFSMFLFSCSMDNAEDPLTVFREIAYNALTTAEKASIVGDWKQAEVSAWVDGNYIVVFQTTDSDTLGPIRVIVDPDTGRVVEKLPR
jgi:hypothetical protein